MPGIYILKKYLSSLIPMSRAGLKQQTIIWYFESGSLPARMSPPPLPITSGAQKPPGILIVKLLPVVNWASTLLKGMH